MINKFTILLSALSFAFQVQAQSSYTKCMASPEAVTISQPDGTHLTVVGRGNIDINYTESVSGYTLIKNKAGIYEYAIRSVNGELLASGVKATDTYNHNSPEAAFVKEFPAHIRYSEEKIQSIINGRNARAKQSLLPDDQHDHDKSVTSSFPGKGKRKVLMLLIQYPDLKASYSRQDFVNMMNQKNYKNIGSYKDFYEKNSFGKLSLETDVVGWYTAQNSYKYYANNSPNGMATSRELVAEAIDAAEAEGVDFSQYDNDKDGDVDGILVVHSGPGAEEGSQNNYIWSHRWDLGWYDRNYDKVTIDNYAINPETRGSMPSRMVGIGVFCHEFGHLLGLPDLYDVNKESEGIGNWSVMAGGNWLNNENTPAGFCAFTRTYMNWVTPLTIEDDGYYTLKPAANDSLIYKITTRVPHEYFLLENRQLTGFDAKLNGKGLAIWHINDSVVKREIWSNHVNGNEKRKGVDLEEADGKDDLDKGTNRGDAGDLYPGTTKNTNFTDISKPNALNYNGNKTGVNVFDITLLPDSSVRFGYGPQPQVDFNAPLLICQNVPVSFQNTSKFASAYTWEFADGTVDTSENGSYTFNEAGQFYVKLTGKSISGLASEDSMKITVVPNAKSGFRIKGEKLKVTLTNTTQNAEKVLVIWGDSRSSSQTENLINEYADSGEYTITMVAYSEGGCTDTFTQTVSVPFKDPRVTAYPNPFRNNLNLDFIVPQDGNVSIEMFNTLGQIIAQVPAKHYPEGFYTEHFSIHENLPNGVYTMRLLINNRPVQMQVVKW